MNSPETIFAAIWAAYDQDESASLSLKRIIALTCDTIDVAETIEFPAKGACKSEEEDTDIIDRDLESLGDLWDEPPSSTWVNQAEVETDACQIVVEVAKLPRPNAGIVSYSQLRARTQLSNLRIDRAMSFLVAKGTAMVFKRDVWVFAIERLEPASLRTDSRLDILLDDRLMAVYCILSPVMTEEQRDILIECLNQISKLRPNAGGMHFVPR
jgi:hypothetical protein